MNLFQKRALKLRERGYTIVPVKAGEKRPIIPGWQNLEPDESDIRGWAAREYKNGNVGINTRNTPAVDIDVYDADFAQELEAWIADQYGDLCVRVGRAPKRAIVFRTDEPFRKMYATFSDGTTDHKIEILGAGQQFVAYGIHPDTKGPYTWTSIDDPMSVDVDQLPELTKQGAEDIVEKFCFMCEERGWELLSKNGEAHSAARGDEDGLDNYKPVLTISAETVRDTLDVLPNKDADFDAWLEVGMALHHQFQGGPDGLEIWHEWSAQSSKNEASEVNRRWNSFGRGSDTVTFASLLKRAKLVRAATEERRFSRAMNQINATNTQKKLREEVIPELAQSFPNEIMLEEAMAAVQRRLTELSPESKKPRLDLVKKLFKAAMPKVERSADLPRWCEHWVYVQLENNFYNTKTGARFSASAFDRTFGRELISEENRDKGESFAGKASDVALNIYRIPVAYDYLYYPGEGEFITVNDMRIVNTYNHLSVPLAQAPNDAASRAAVALFERHFEELIKDERERMLLLDYLAYNVQYPSERVHWAPVLQGVDGGGKSWMKALMAAVMGGTNVGTASAGDLHEQYTAWAEGKKLVFFEEVRVQGADKFDIVNKVKQYITNPSVSVRRMQRNSYEIPNMTNYFIFTNYLDAIPYDRNDRRYFVVRTRFLTVSHITKFNEENPTYFDDMFGILGRHYPAIRWWLEQRVLSDEFQPKRHAPRTAAWELMYEEANNVDDSEDPILQAIREHGPDNPLLTEEVLSAEALKDVCPEVMGISGRSLSKMLNQAGFQLVGKFRLGGRESPNGRIYTRKSEVFHENPDESDLDVIRRLTRRPGDSDDGFD